MTGSTWGPNRAARVVIVDDTWELRELLCLAMTRAGFDVVAEAADGAAGIDAASAYRPDLVVLDLEMPGLNGLDALPGLRAAAPDAVVVIHSSHRSARVRALAAGLGADGYVNTCATLRHKMDYFSGLLGEGARSAPL